MEPKARAKFEQAASIEYSQFDPIGGGILVERLFKPRRGQTPNEERVKELVSQLEGKLDGYEAILGRQKYLAGDVRSFDRPKRVRGKAVDADDGLLPCAGDHPRRSLPFAIWHDDL